MKKETLNIIASLINSSALFLIAFKPAEVNHQMDVLVGVLIGVSGGIFLTNYIKKSPSNSNDIT